MNRIKVLCVAGTMEMGGVENQLMHLLRNADKDMFQIDFTSTKKDAYFRKEIEELGGKVHVIPRMSWKNPIPYFSALYNLMKNENYDIVHSNELFHSGIIVWIAHLARVKKCIAHSHSSSDARGLNDKRSMVRKIYNSIMRASILKYSDMKIACSTVAGEFLFGNKATIKENYQVIYNSIDCAKYIDNFDVQEEGEYCDEWINVFHVGRVYPVKNQLFITEIAEEFKKRNKNVRFLCAGDTFDKEYMDQIIQRIVEKDLKQYMVMLGNRSDVDVLMRKSSVFILPSVYEGMPLALIEAQAAGVNCVVADTFSREVDFEMGTVSWMSISANAEQWADEIEKMIVMHKAEKVNVANAIEKKKFDSKMFSKEICKLYMKLMKEK